MARARTVQEESALMGWVLIILMAVLVLIALWRFGKFDKAALQFLGAALLVAFAGYAWQGWPGLEGQPVPPPVREKLPDTAFAEVRGDMLGEFDVAARWLTIADSYHRRGDTLNAAGVINADIREHPKNADLWVGLGNALVIHAGGLMTPAAELAFQRAAAIAPEHPGPKFFYGLALAQGGKFDEAEAIWRSILATAPAGVSWRPMIEERLIMLEQARAMGVVR
jgi:cytochrome c-type biogenesis protein CcmH